MISLIHPSRGRPDKSFATVNNWILKSGAHRSQIEVVVSVDANDPMLTRYLSYYPDALISDNTCVVEATNKAAHKSKGDILIYLSDDFDCPDNWWSLVTNEFKDGGMRLVKVDDCLQKFDVPVLTIPIMSRELYKHLGYFWHPGYKSMFVDVDLFYTCRKLGAIRNAEHLKFPHIHPANPNPQFRSQNDKTYEDSSKNWKQGEDFFNKRRGEGFPL